PGPHRPRARLGGARHVRAVPQRPPVLARGIPSVSQDPHPGVRAVLHRGGPRPPRPPGARPARVFGPSIYFPAGVSPWWEPTPEGVFDLVGNNIPVFFIQDALKFPDLIHALKMEPDRGFPQATSAHDTFWDFVSLMPETMHMVMWTMSDRAIPRSLRMMEGFGVNTYRLIDARGVARFVKWHWRPAIGTSSVL